MIKLIIILSILFFCTNLFAVELLVKRQANYVNSDPVKNEAGVYQRGDIVVIMSDGHSWGKEEHPLTTTYTPPKFFIVRVLDKTVEQAQKYLASRFNDIDPDMLKTRRLYQLLADDVPQWVKNSIQATGEVTVTWSQIKNFIRNKKTGQTEL